MGAKNLEPTVVNDPSVLARLSNIAKNLHDTHDELGRIVGNERMAPDEIGLKQPESLMDSVDSSIAEIMYYEDRIGGYVANLRYKLEGTAESS